MKGFLSKCLLYFVVPFGVSVFLLLFLQTPIYYGDFISHKNYNPITIRRDQYGIPTIESKTLIDTFYGLGHVHAQDRLWVVNFRRLLASGRLSEVLGAEVLEIDKFFRNLSLKRYCADAESVIDPQTKAIFQAYIDGFNDYVASIKVLPIEFWITWSTFEPLTLMDAAVLGKTMSFFLAMDFPYEFIFGTLEKLVGAEVARDILPIAVDKFFFNDAVIMNDDDLKQSGIFEPFNENFNYQPLEGFEFPAERRVPEPLANQKAAPKQHASTIQDNIEPTHHEHHGLGDKIKETIVAEKTRYITGSNAWVIHGNHTDTGKPILANDPHLPNAMPSFWYEVALIYEGNYATGLSYPGWAGLSFGKTKYMSWGFTNLCADTTDLYDLVIDGDSYFFEGAWRPLKKFEEKIYIRGRAEPEIVTVYESHHGVVIDNYATDILLGTNFAPEKGRRYALRWIGYTMDNNSLKPFNRILGVKTANEFVDQWKESIEPSMALLFASTEGDIGFIAVGKHPIRKNVRDGAKPKDGTKKENDWLGYVPWEYQPKVINPKKGYIVSANNKFSTDNIKYGITSNMWLTTRAARITEMIEEFVGNGKKISVEDTKLMQTDVLDKIAKEVCPSLVHFTRLAQTKKYSLSVSQEKLSKIIDMIEGWDYRLTEDSAAASIFSVWHNKLIQKVLRKVGLSEQAWEGVIGNFKFEAFLYRKILEWHSTTPDYNEFWCLNDENENLETPCLYNLIKSLEETYVYLQNEMGENPDKWNWNKIHIMQYPQLPFSETPLKRFFHRTIPTGGNARAVFAAGFRPEKGVEGLWGPNMRMVVSMREGDTSYSIIDTGISENIMSKHYNDQMKLFHENKWLEMVEDVSKGEWEHIRNIQFN